MNYDMGIVRSLLGKRIVTYMLLAGLIPLIVFTVPMYFQSYDVMRRKARQSLEDYSKLASGQLFQTLKQGEQRLVRLAQTGESPTSSEAQAYFTSVRRFEDVDELKPFSFAETWDLQSILNYLKADNNRHVRLTPAFRTNNGVTLGMVTLGSDNSIWVGIIKPSILWQPLRGSYFGDRDLAVVLDQNGRILASSRGLFKPLSHLSEYFSGSFPSSGIGYGVETIDGFGKSLWVSKQLWLKGAFGSGRWQLIFFREHGAVQSLPLSLLESLGIWFFLALAGLVLISFRFARQLFRPINKMSRVTHELAGGNWEAEVDVKTGDELEALADNFNDMRDTIKETNEQLKHDATHDRLTGLPNRVLLEDRVQHMIDFAKRNSDYGFAVVFLDLDRFKVINDSLGHNAGDELLKGVAERLKQEIRETDMLVRLGGDEFVIVLDSILNVEKAVQAAEKFDSVLSRSFDIKDQEVFIGASMGISFYRDQYEKAEQILRDADTAMYRAKNRDTPGTSYVVFGELMRDEAQHRLDLETDIQAAIQKGQFELRYQPILDLESGKTAGVEALLRWNHPEKGWISPEKFIPLAEEIGSIKTIGKWVLEESSKRLSEWKENHGSDAGWISVNLSPKQLFDEMLIDDIDRLLSEQKFDPIDYKLEVTEDALITSTEHAVEVLEELQKLGVQVCMDDFGTGHSSLSLLQDLPIDILKIDRKFVKDIHRNDDGRAIIAAVTGLAGEMDLTVVAEGIETEEELSVLRQMHCELGQGFLFARPMKGDAYENHIRRVDRFSFSEGSAGVSTVLKSPMGKT